jgi:DNA-binding MarR family transcriptional regulator/GNAT superfamily N-acetyltransferase
MRNDPELIRNIRDFNRFYTNLLGLLDRAVHNSPYSQTENRVLFEIFQSGETSARELQQRLRIDAGYLSRVLGNLERQKLIKRVRAESDLRQHAISLTEAGLSVRRMLDLRADEEIRSLIDNLDANAQRRLLSNMETIRALLRAGEQPTGPLVIRPPHLGEFGWMLQTFATCYGDQPGWGPKAEAEAASAVAASLGHDDADWTAWIAEVDGQPVGATVCAVESGTARVPFLSVIPSARRSGIGTALLKVCLRHARQAGASHLEVWTDADMTASTMLEGLGAIRTEEVLIPQKSNVSGPRRRWVASC